MNITFLNALNEARSARQAVVLITDLDDGSQRLVRREQVADDPLSKEIAARLRSGKSGIVESGTGEVFVQVQVPPPRLVVIGAVHISQALAPMAEACGFGITIIDPRTAFATPERFAGKDLHADWPEDILKDKPLDAFDALLALTHDPKIDDLPLIEALKADCFYVGALGSRKTHAKRCDRLRAAGMNDAQLARIHAPIGLDIGAASPSEIAVAVLAEVIASLRQQPLATTRDAA